jgi:hypothetical protein
MGLYHDTYGPASNIEFREAYRYVAPQMDVYATEYINMGLTQHATFDVACAAAQ